MFSDATAAILAGGAGRRLGGATKALLEVGGRTILERQRAVLGALFPRVIVVTPDAAPFERLDVEIVADRFAGRGAPGGVHAALEAAATPWVFCVAGDMPFVRREPIELMASLRPGQGAVVPERGGFLEPLFAFYGPGCRARFADALRGGSPSLIAVLADVGALRVDESRLRRLDPALTFLTNVNTPEDLARARASAAGAE